MQNIIRRSHVRAHKSIGSGESPGVRKCWKRCDNKLRRAYSKIVIAQALACDVER